MQTKIRKAGADDLDFLEMAEAEIFPDAWSRKSLEEEISSESPLPRIFILETEEGLLGYFVGALVLDELQIYRIAIAPMYRDRGLGKELLQVVLAEAKEVGAVVATLEVRETNAVARNLYRRMGFTEVGRREKYYKSEAAILMDCKIM